MPAFFGKQFNNHLLINTLLVSAFTLTATCKVAAAKPEAVSGQDAVKQELASIALASLQAENDTLVSGDPDAAIRKNPKARKALRQLTKKLSQQKEKKEFLEKKKVKFKGSKTSLDIKNFQLSGQTAVLEATERTSRDYDLSVMASGSPEKMEEIVDHKFTFTQSNNDWELTSDETPNTPSAPRNPRGEEIPSVPVDPKIAPADPLASPSQTFLLTSLLSQSPAASENDLRFYNRSSGVKIAGTLLENIELMPNSFQIAQATINRDAIVRYLYLYALTPNRDYRNFENSGTRGGDCTNFVSQAMAAGGWAQVFLGDLDAFTQRSNPAVWFYNSVSQSYTWINAGYFFNFIRDRPRARTIGRVADLIPGDVISVDFDPGANNGIDHTMVVSKKANDGTIYLAYHTNNTLDKTFYQFWKESEAQSAGGRYYAWSLVLAPP